MDKTIQREIKTNLTSELNWFLRCKKSCKASSLILVILIMKTAVIFPPKLCLGPVWHRKLTCWETARNPDLQPDSIVHEKSCFWKVSSPAVQLQWVWISSQTSGCYLKNLNLVSFTRQPLFHVIDGLKIIHRLRDTESSNGIGTFQIELLNDRKQLAAPQDSR